MKAMHRTRGFTLVEIAIGIALVGLLLLAFAGMTTVVQRSASETRQYTDAQQNARAALDYITEMLRAAGADVAAYEGQGAIVAAGPYQIVFNADIDQGQTVAGQNPLEAIDVAQSPNTVPAAGTAVYTPTKTFASTAETIVLTLDSNADGVVNDSDRGDNDEENGQNPHVYVLKSYAYGHETGVSNTVRDADVAILRGPVAFDNGDLPAPLFQYYYDHDDNLTTPDLLWGDANANGHLESGEVAALTNVPDNLLFGVRMVKVNVTAEGLNPAGPDNANQRFPLVTMTSRVWVRNVDNRESARVYGTVYFDANGNGQRDAGEPGIPQVLITLSNGRRTLTDAYGDYNIPTGGGSWSVIETDPAGYSSTTSNTVSFTVTAGEKYKVNFGDDNNLKFGYLVGTVWDDADKNGMMDGGEAGLPGVDIKLNNGMSGKTNANGYYRLTVNVGSYVITETDPEGYTSTTANSLSASIVDQGDSVITNFGDVVGDATGTLAGHVFEDQDQDTQRDFDEPGLSGVSITLSNGKSATTDADGYYEFALDPGKYDVYELDPDGYTSTTPNLVGDITIVSDTVVTLDFGDILIKDLEFVEILVSDTDRPLSLSVADMREDGRADTDIVLGTPTSGGPGNTFFYTNEYKDGSTPVSELFDSTPDHIRKAGDDVNAIETMDLDGDKNADVMTGLESYSGNNVLFWYNDSKGSVSTSADQFVTAGSSAAVTRLRIAEVDGDGMRDFAVGLKSKLTPFTGGFEIFHQYYTGAFTSGQVETMNGAGTMLGNVSAIAFGDLNGDGTNDLVLGSNQGDYWGHVDIFLNDGSGKFTWKKRLLSKAGVNDLVVTEMHNDADLLPDILVGISDAGNVGGVQVWYNKNGVFGVDDPSGFVYDSDTDKKIPDDYFDAGGEVLTVSAARLDGDIFPEILVGTRSSIFYTGDLMLVRMINGDTKVENIKVNIAGEVVTIDFADFNKDSNTDIVVTTRTSATAGKLAIYFLDDASVIP